jgi:hypothetical protein
MFSFVSFLCAKEKKEVCFFAPKKSKETFKIGIFKLSDLWIEKYY